MIYPANFENKIGFNQIRSLIKAKCSGVPAKGVVDKITFTTDVNFIRTQLSKTAEMMEICLLKDDFPSLNYMDSEHIKSKLLTEDYSLQLIDFVEIKSQLNISKSLNHFFRKQSENKYPLISKMVSNIVFPNYVYDRINDVVSRNGSIKDSASKNLKEIRSNLNAQNQNVIKTLEKILSRIRSELWIDKDLSATMINGRLVLPIETTHKRKIKGIIHDESASGKTSYIEPSEVVEINNHIRELEIAERREIQKILYDLTQDIRPYYDVLSEISKLIKELDFLRAKALFSIEIKAVAPGVEFDSCIELYRARHPLLYLSLKKENKEVIPIDIKIDKENRILVISGPNAGGKSVALKTAGLLIYMVQCGIPVPVGGTSVFGVFEKMFIDIGDDQSIDNDLSTYSSHLISMKYFLKNSDDKTLILIDEFGAGTDPLTGGFIAEAILEELNNLKVFGVITTHYSNLKIFASNTKGIQNGAMQIDNNKMKSLFILEQGIPGSSYALEIAARTGLPEKIIESSREKAGEDKVNVDKFVRKLMKDKRYWERKRSNIRKKEKQIEELYLKHISELENIILKRGKIIDEAKTESKILLESINKTIENTIREIKESKADKDKTVNLRKNLNQFKEKVTEKLEIDNSELHNELDKLIKKAKNKSTPEFAKIDRSEIHIGSKVRLIGQDTIGEVTDINEKNAIICYGNIYTSVSKKNLEKVPEVEYKKQNRNKSHQPGIISKKVLDFKPEIDLRGCRTDEALQKLSVFIDEAVMISSNRLRVLHGKGDGILRHHIRAYLKTLDCITEYNDEEERFGGYGITVISLK